MPDLFRHLFAVCNVFLFAKAIFIKRYTKTSSTCQNEKFPNTIFDVNKLNSNKFIELKVIKKNLKIMNNKLLALIFISIVAVSSSFCQDKSKQYAHNSNEGKKEYEISKSESEWKNTLSPEEYEVLRKKGTEYAFTGKFYEFKEKGIFTCAGCGNELFDSKTKYNSGSGWPSFYKPIDKNNIDLEIDKSLGSVREEILCSKCGGHLGHVFNDGPKPTGLRYCVNSVSLHFIKK